MFRTGAIILVVVALSACGFHLRGTQQALEKWQIKVQADIKSVSPFATQILKQQLESNNASGQAKGVSIDIIQLNFKKRTLVLDNKARPIEFIMQLSMSYKQQVEAGEVKAHTINLEQNYLTNPANLLSADQQENELKQKLLVKACDRIKYQLYVDGLPQS